MEEEGQMVTADTGNFWQNLKYVKQVWEEERKSDYFDTILFELPLKADVLQGSQVDTFQI